MKTLLTTFLIAFVALTSAFAQRTIDARTIIDQINRNQTVSYENVIIVGDLDLTALANQREIRNSGRGMGSEYLSTVTVPMTFRNCTFRNKVLAYRTDDENGKLFSGNNRVYNADFDEAVTFDNCIFESDAAFKYSAFRQQTVFAGGSFRDVALFKYAKFSDMADFSGVQFRGPTDFKYTKFGEKAAFGDARFSSSADFKYTKFEDGVTFQNARFTGPTDFKYVRFPRQTNLKNVAFDGLSDFKYTTLDGERYSPEN